MLIPIARAVTRPRTGFDSLDTLGKFNPCPPDLMMVTLLKGSEKFLKSNCVYKLVYNKFSDTIELVEVGEANIGKYWSRNFYEIESEIGKARTWFSKEEFENLKEV